MSHNPREHTPRIIEIQTPSSRASRSPSVVNRRPSVSLILPFVSSGLFRPKSEAGSTESPNYCYTNENSNGYTDHYLPSSTEEQHSFIDKFPFEIRYMVAQCLSQYDAVNLLRVNRAFFQSTVIRLYHTIIVDPDYSSFDQELYLEDDSVIPVWECTFIKVKHSFKNFLKQLSEDITYITDEREAPLQYASLINEIKVVELPDNFYTPFDLQFFSTISIKKMSHLHKLYWSSEVELPFDIIERLPNKQNFNTLNLNLDFKKIQSHGTTHNTERAPAKDLFQSFQGFHQLEKLSIESFWNSDNLFQLFHNLITNDDNIRSTGNLDRLVILKLARFNSTHHYLKNPSTSLLVLTQYLIEKEKVDLREYDLDCLQLLTESVKSSGNLESLRKLAFDSIVVSTRDVDLLSQIVQWDLITHLELRNITEVQCLIDVTTPIAMQQLYEKLDGGFLQNLANHMDSLTELYIDYRESLRDTVPDFIESLHRNAFGGLKELDITIRWNVTKLCSIHSWKDLCTQYIKSILAHSMTLEKLSLETKEDSVFSELHKLIFTDSLLELKKMSKLKSLRLHGFSIQPYAPLLASFLPELKYFELFGSAAGGAPHMGLQVFHDGVLDDWLRVQHVAAAINEQNPGIKFIKIDRCLFEIQNGNTVIPRHSNLENWFDEKVRVSLNRELFN